MQRWRILPPSTPAENDFERQAVDATAQTELCALVLVAAGRGPARVPTCEQTLQHASTRAQQARIWTHLNGRYLGPFFDYPCARDGVLDYGPKRAGDFYPVLVHALSLFGPGELRELRVPHADVFRVIVAMMQVLPSGGALLPQMAQALTSLRVIEIAEWTSPTECWPHVAAVVNVLAPTITELKGGLPGRLMCTSYDSGNPPILARCTRLEILTPVCDCAPDVWLGLSQLHTLDHVNLDEVSIAAIAAALPKLHTLKAYYDSTANDSASVSGFFTDLLPRLRVLHFWGKWPADAPASATEAPLPELEELVWKTRSGQAALRGFLGARPMVLHAPYESLMAECLADRNPRRELLARVCELRVLFGRAAPTDPAEIARVLRAAPRLRTLHDGPLLPADAAWLTSSALPLHPAFVDLVHPRLRHLSVHISGSAAPSRDDGCAARLRQTCFPWLRELTVDGETIFVTPGGG
jgi:hypothetical protein